MIRIRIICLFLIREYQFSGAAAQITKIVFVLCVRALFYCQQLSWGKKFWYLNSYHYSVYAMPQLIRKQFNNSFRQGHRCLFLKLSFQYCEITCKFVCQRFSYEVPCHNIAEFATTRNGSDCNDDCNIYLDNL